MTTRSMNHKSSVFALALFLVSAGMGGGRAYAAAVDADGKPVPRELLSAYQTFVEAAKAGDIGALTALALPSSLPVSVAPRAQGKEEFGTDVNMPFLKKGFHPEIVRIHNEKKNCYLIRTGSTALWYVRGADKRWWIYKYLDKPME